MATEAKDAAPAPAPDAKPAEAKPAEAPAPEAKARVSDAKPAEAPAADAKAPADAKPAEPAKPAEAPKEEAKEEESKEFNLEELFLKYCKFGDHANPGNMKGATWMKLMEDAKLIDANLNKAKLDLIFTKSKAKGAKSILFAEFQNALNLASAAKYPKEEAAAALEKLMEPLKKLKAPKAKATKADAVKFHDDKSTYTGVYKQGGPSTDDKSITLGTLLDRTPADVRGRKTSSPKKTAPAASPKKTTPKKSAPAPAKKAAPKKK